MYHAWGAGWRGQHGLVKTNDGTIPYKLFLHLLGGLSTLQAGREAELMNAITLGVANAFAGKDDKRVEGAVSQLRKAAFPMRFD